MRKRVGLFGLLGGDIGGDWTDSETALKKYRAKRKRRLAIAKASRRRNRR